MRMFACVTSACTFFLGFSCSRWWDTKGPWLCSKDMIICSYLETK
jgi:hypothetical protein